MNDYYQYCYFHGCYYYYYYYYYYCYYYHYFKKMETSKGSKISRAYHFSLKFYF